MTFAFAKILLLVVFVHNLNCLETACYTTLLQSQDCSWYTKCLEEKYQCGKKGYPVGYGFKYCSKFSQLKQNADPAVVEWILKTTVCLKNGLVKFIQDESKISNLSKSCKQLKKQAFDSHPICYTKSGFCKLWRELGIKGSQKFIRQLFKTFELKDFLSYIAIKQIIQTIGICEKQLGFSYFEQV